MHRAFLLLLPALIFGCGTDTKPSGPRVSSTVPSDGATGVPLLPDIAVTFSADMDVETVSASLSGSACTGAIQLSADDFVISQWLSSGGPTDTVPVQIYAATRAAPLPSVNAIATIMMVSTLLIVTAGFLTWRFLTRGERRPDEAGEDFGSAFDLT